MSLQIIKSVNGKPEYVLLPIDIYNALSLKIKKKLTKIENASEYAPFNVADYVNNPIALARIKAHITQEMLAKKMKVTQAYVSKIEKQKTVTAKLLEKVNLALKKK